MSIYYDQRIGLSLKIDIVGKKNVGKEVAEFRTEEICGQLLYYMVAEL